MTDCIAQGVLVAEFKPLILAQHIQGSVPADGEKPSLEVIAHFLRLGEIEFEQSILNDLTSSFHITMKNSCRVGDEIALMLIQSPPDKQSGFFGLGLTIRHEFTVLLNNGDGKPLLEASVSASKSDLSRPSPLSDGQSQNDSNG